ncbi:MAG: nodulation protein NfeD [Candidatus Krumholzibacteriia bacterium]
MPRRIRSLTAAAVLAVGAALLATGPAAQEETTTEGSAGAAGDTLSRSDDMPLRRDPPLVWVLPYDGPITPVASEYLGGSLAQAAASGVTAVVIALDTPGGLDTAMRSIIKDMLAAPLPVVVYVSPSGARAASAGAFITIAANVAAMAPGTNIGSASPVQMGGAEMDTVMAKKVAHDAAAYIASLARQRGRNTEVARSFVVEAANLTAREALEANIVDIVAPSLPALLDSLQGRRIRVADVEVELDLAGAVVEERAMGWRQSLLKRLADPNLAYILMLIGIYGIFFELSNPGALVPGILGGICLLLALFAFQTLPVNFAGFGLILLGVILLILEIKVTSFGALSIGGVTSLVLGSLMLFDSPEPWAQISLSVLIPAVVAFSGFFILAVWLVIRAQRRPAVSGREALVGATGRVVVAIPGGSGRGKVFFHGEMWDAEASEEVPAGHTVVVTEIVGRVALVRPTDPGVERVPSS